jgi:hypothetical protein
MKTIWRVIWSLSLWAHFRASLPAQLWRIWWALGYRAIYPAMWRWKAQGYAWAQPFGEGEEGVRQWLASQ